MRKHSAGAVPVWSSYIYHKSLKGQKNEEVDFTDSSAFCHDERSLGYSRSLRLVLYIAGI
jgi:hypothetical protein